MNKEIGKRERKPTRDVVGMVLKSVGLAMLISWITWLMIISMVYY